MTHLSTVVVGSRRRRLPDRVRPGDGRSAEAVWKRKIQAELTAHVGGNPSVTEQILIERIATLRLYLARMDAKALDQADISDADSQKYLRWTTALTRALHALGPKVTSASQEKAA